MLEGAAAFNDNLGRFVQRLTIGGKKNLAGRFLRLQVHEGDRPDASFILHVRIGRCVFSPYRQVMCVLESYEETDRGYKLRFSHPPQTAIAWIWGHALGKRLLKVALPPGAHRRIAVKEVKEELKSIFDP